MSRGIVRVTKRRLLLGLHVARMEETRHACRVVIIIIIMGKPTLNRLVGRPVKDKIKTVYEDERWI
jgi:hypothetical protein